MMSDVYEYILSHRREKLETLRAQRIEELEAALRSIIFHWREFGPEHGLDELMDVAAKRLRKEERA